MIKRIFIATIAIVLVGAVGVGIYDAYQGKSSLAMPSVMADGSPQASQPAGGQAGHSPMQGQHEPGMARGQQGQGAGQANGSGQPVDREWQTLSGTVIELQPQALSIFKGD
jgi:hypothetical protein